MTIRVARAGGWQREPQWSIVRCCLLKVYARVTWTQEGFDEITRLVDCTLLRVLGCLHAGSIVEWADGTTRRQGDACPMWILHDQPQLAIPSGVALQIRKRIMPCPSNCLVRCCISIDVVNLFPPGNFENGYQHPGIYQETGRHRCPIPQPTTPSKMNATTVQK